MIPSSLQKKVFSTKKKTVQIQYTNDIHSLFLGTYFACVPKYVFSEVFSRVFFPRFFLKFFHGFFVLKVG